MPQPHKERRRQTSSEMLRTRARLLRTGRQAPRDRQRQEGRAVRLVERLAAILGLAHREHPLRHRRAAGRARCGWSASRADNAEDDAAFAINYASAAIEEAEYLVLHASLARRKAHELAASN